MSSGSRSLHPWSLTKGTRRRMLSEWAVCGVGRLSSVLIVWSILVLSIILTDRAIIILTAWSILIDSVIIILIV